MKRLQEWKFILEQRSIKCQIYDDQIYFYSRHLQDIQDVSFNSIFPIDRQCRHNSSYCNFTQFSRKISPASENNITPHIAPVTPDPTLSDSTYTPITAATHKTNPSRSGYLQRPMGRLGLAGARFRSGAAWSHNPIVSGLLEP